ncbi:hypothetical protein EDB86DRAFT_3210275 [Lactarius hatsudake]|nr:hypothetical protein EDB86DRAFT_3210275 [Lactarius hatsudake]
MGRVQKLAEAERVWCASSPISCAVATKEDIAKYIGSKVNGIANDKRWQEDDKELVIQTLSDMVDGMFRWVYCQLEMLRHCLPSKIWQSVNKLPKTLDKTYKWILEEIPETNQDHVLCLPQCLAVAVRPLRVKELAEVLAFDWDASLGVTSTTDACLT